ncbi:MAG: hypothetical protein ACC669_10290 [bacterium]
MISTLRHKKTILFIFTALFTGLPALAYANIGLPMIFITLPWMVVSLIPVIAVEGHICSRRLDLTPGTAVKVTTASNLTSTFIGIPITWGILVALQMLTGGGGSQGIDTVLGKLLAVTWQAPWLIPYEKDLYWMVPSAGMVLMLPYFFASWLVEYQVTRRLLPDKGRKDVKRSVLYANLASYALLELVIAGYLVYSVLSAT